MNTLIRGSFQESETAKNLLANAKISFREVFSDQDNNHHPVLITNSSAFSYRGVSQIKNYCEHKKELKNNS